MAFGLPALFQKTIAHRLSREEVLERIKKTFQTLEWKIIDEDEFYIEGKTLNGAMTFGERVQCDVREQMFAIRSECILPTQIIDFGKNKKNVDAFLKVFYKLPFSGEELPVDQAQKSIN